MRKWRNITIFRGIARLSRLVRSCGARIGVVWSGTIQTARECVRACDRESGCGPEERAARLFAQGTASRTVPEGLPEDEQGGLEG